MFYTQTLNPKCYREDAEAYIPGKHLVKVSIIVKEKIQYSENTEKLQWYVTMPSFISRQWYFEYRYALLKVKYPRHYFWFTSSLINTTEKEELAYKLKAAKDTLTSKKRNVTKTQNKIQQFTDEWKKRYPMGIIEYMDEPAYKKAIEKLAQKNRELEEAETKYNELLTKNQ